MKNLKMIFAGALVLAAVNGSLHAFKPTTRRTQDPIERVDKEMSLLDQIIEHVNTLMGPVTPRTSSRIKKELTRLVNHEDLDAKIKEAIAGDIEIIKNPKTKPERRAAYDRLLEVYKTINAQAHVVETVAEATEMVKNASPEEIEEAIKKAKEKIKKAEEWEQSTMGRMYKRAQEMVAVPVDYVFGEEDSWAKHRFYDAAKIAMAAAAAYAAYRGVDYLINKPFSGGSYGHDERDSVKIIRSSWTPHMKEYLKEEFGDDLQAQEEGLRAMLPALDAEKIRLLEYDASLDRQIAAAKAEQKDFVAHSPMLKEQKQLPSGVIVTRTEAKNTEEAELVEHFFDLSRKIGLMKSQKNKNLMKRNRIDQLESYHGELKYRSKNAQKTEE